MVVVELVGGLGNQFFEYATARKLAIDNNDKLYVAVYHYAEDNLRKYELDHFNINAREIIVKDARRDFAGWIVLLLAKHILPKIGKSVQEAELYKWQDITSKSYLTGYWQNQRYFRDIRDRLAVELSINEDKLPSESLNVYRDYLSRISKENSVAVHIRRTDYLNHADNFCILDEKYYSRAISYIKEYTENPIFYVFSDDVDWCKGQEVFKEENVVFMDYKVPCSEIVDFGLMKACKHFIIANSTYSWWASFLGESQEKNVISPEKWVRDDEKNEVIKEALLEDAILI